MKFDTVSFYLNCRRILRNPVWDKWDEINGSFKLRSSLCLELYSLNTYREGKCFEQNL
jgi:hypothetical protein